MVKQSIQFFHPVLEFQEGPREYLTTKLSGICWQDLHFSNLSLEVLNNTLTSLGLVELDGTDHSFIHSLIQPIVIKTYYALQICTLEYSGSDIVLKADFEMEQTQAL